MKRSDFPPTFVIVFTLMILGGIACLLYSSFFQRGIHFLAEGQALISTGSGRLFEPSNFVLLISDRAEGKVHCQLLIGAKLEIVAIRHDVVLTKVLSHASDNQSLDLAQARTKDICFTDDHVLLNKELAAGYRTQYLQWEKDQEKLNQEVITSREQEDWARKVLANEKRATPDTGVLYKRK